MLKPIFFFLGGEPFKKEINRQHTAYQAPAQVPATTKCLKN